MGFQYRFEENFVKGEETELRFTEEYTYSIQPKVTEFEFRLRAEQRITSSTTSHRLKYNIATSRSFKGGDIDSGYAYIFGGLETFFTLAKTSKPEYEQRIGAGVGWVLNNYIKLELIMEYRITNFTQNLSHELFLVSGMKFTLDPISS